MLYPSELQARGWLPEASEEADRTSLVRFYRRMGADASAAGSGKGQLKDVSTFHGDVGLR